VALEVLLSHKLQHFWGLQSIEQSLWHVKLL